MNKKKRVLVCAAHFYPHVGGSEKYILELYSRMTKQIEIDVLVSDFEKNPSFEEYKGLNIYRLDSWCLLGNTYPIPKINLNNLIILSKIRENNYLFINTHTRFFIITTLGYFISKINKTMLIHTEHGTSSAVYNNRNVEIISSLYDKTVGSLIVRSSKFTIGISKASNQFLKQLGAKKTYLIPNGVDTDYFRKYKVNLRNDLNISDDSAVITFIGRLTHPKGVQDLIKAFFYLESKLDNIELLIVGNGSYEKELKKMGEKSSKIQFLGSRNDISEILSITDIFVNPSHYEGLPTSVLEAGSVGIPIIATNVGGTKEIFIEEMGILVEPHNPEELAAQIEFMLKNLSQFKNSRKIREHIEDNFSWDINAKKFLKILNLDNW